MLDDAVRKATVVNLKLKQPFDVYIGRPSKWGNPFVLGRNGTRAQVVAQYRRYLLGQPALLALLGELAGKRLGCFCAPRPCHGDVLAELVNEHVSRKNN